MLRSHQERQPHSHSASDNAAFIGDTPGRSTANSTARPSGGPPLGFRAFPRSTRPTAPEAISNQQSRDSRQPSDHQIDMPPLYDELLHPVRPDNQLPSYEEAIKL